MLTANPPPIPLYFPLKNNVIEEFTSTTKYIKSIWMSVKVCHLRKKHCVKYRHFKEFPGVKVLWKGTVST